MISEDRFLKRDLKVVELHLEKSALIVWKLIKTQLQLNLHEYVIKIKMFFFSVEKHWQQLSVSS